MEDEINQIYLEASRLQKEIAKYNKELDNLKFQRNRIIECIDCIDNGKNLTPEDFKLIDLSTYNNTSKFIIKLKYKGKLNIIDSRLQKYRIELKKKEDMIESLSTCPFCSGKGFFHKETEYIRQERQIIPRISTEICEVCKGTGRIELP